MEAMLRAQERRWVSVGETWYTAVVASTRVFSPSARCFDSMYSRLAGFAVLVVSSCRCLVMNVAGGDALAVGLDVVVLVAAAAAAAVAGESSYQSPGLALAQRRDCGLGFACLRHIPTLASSCPRSAAACLAWVAATVYPTFAGDWE